MGKRIAAKDISIERFVLRRISTKMAEKDTWPTEEDLGQCNEVIKWRDLGKGVYRIHIYRQTKNSYGDAFILRLGPPEVRSAFGKDYNFLLNEGLAESTKTGREYFKFSL